MSIETEKKEQIIAQIDELKHLFSEDEIAPNLHVKEEVQFVSEDDFVSWMAKSNLAPGMQTQYHYLLKSIPSALGYDDVFTKTNIADFSEYFEKLKEDEFYKSAVDHVGAGAIRSALNKYKAYLEERSFGLVSQEKLAILLKEWYTQKPIQSNATSSLVGFGFKYGYSIKKNKISSKKLLESAQIDSTMGAYIDRGVDLYLSLKDGDIGIDFVNDCAQSSGYSYSSAIGLGNNLVVYGTPGCGKSYYVDHTILGKDNDGKYVGDYKEDNVIRTTFFQDYSNTDFVGQVMPVITTEVNDAGIEEQVVTYRFVPGPFTLALECAIAHPNEKVALVIEELNRGNAPSIFGDLFQLLDRIDEDGKEYPVGTSEYGITNVNIINYLSDNKHYDKKWRYSFNLSEIRIPANLYIFATMNTSDQNVFTLDTAFKRRWEFKKLKNEFTADHAYSGYKVPGMPDVTWKKLVDDINDFIVSDADAIASEDKQIGVYFVAKNMLCSSEKDCDDEQKKLKFAYKLFEYLWDDVAKFSRANWFGDVKTLDKLIEKYLTDGIKVFKDGVIKNNQ